MAEIEFFDTRESARTLDEVVETLDVEPPRIGAAWQTRIARLRTVLPAVLAVAAVVVTLVAPWQRLYELDELFEANERRAVGTDGWGRYFSGFGGVDQHSTRFGIVMCVAAGLVLVGAALRAGAALASQARWHRPASWSIGLGVGVLGGTLASAALQADSVFDAIDAQHADEVANGANFDNFDSGIHLGPMLYLGFGGLVLAVLALAAPFALDRLPTAVPRRPEPEPAGPASHVSPAAAHDDLPTGPVPHWPLEPARHHRSGSGYVAHLDDENLDD